MKGQNDTLLKDMADIDAIGSEKVRLKLGANYKEVKRKTHLIKNKRNFETLKRGFGMVFM